MNVAPQASHLKDPEDDMIFEPNKENGIILSVLLVLTRKNLVKLEDKRE